MAYPRVEIIREGKTGGKLVEVGKNSRVGIMDSGVWVRLLQQRSGAPSTGRAPDSVPAGWAVVARSGTAGLFRGAVRCTGSRSQFLPRASCASEES